MALRASLYWIRLNSTPPSPCHVKEPKWQARSGAISYNSRPRRVKVADTINGYDPT
jgi:hypothetical protein